MPAHRIDDVRITEIRPLIPPAVLMEELPASEAGNELVYRSRLACERILRGEDDRLLVVVGPCSIHDPVAALDYADRLKAYAGTVADDLFLVMRVYFEKPRTTVGWKGLINDPHLDQSFDINHGLHTARKLLCDLSERGVPVGTEFLDTISPQFVADLVSWGAIGARTTESQVHRELASGLSVPVGFKNGTGGSIQIAIDAIKAASGRHSFLSVTKQGVAAIVSTAGNPNCHVILRGSTRGPNYDADAIGAVRTLLEEAGLPPYIMVDCSHGNSLKDHRNQPKVAENLCRQIAGGSRSIVSTMLESHLVAGFQSLDDGSDGLVYGQSVTDACMNWETTTEVLDQFAAAVRARRAKS